jgi:hypothetical protein
MLAAIMAKLISTPHSETKIFQYWPEHLINDNFVIFILPLALFHCSDYDYAFFSIFTTAKCCANCGTY